LSGKVTWFAPADSANRPVYEQRVAAYNQLGRGVTAEFVPNDSGAYTDKLVSFFSAGTPPDVFYVSSSDVKPWADRGLLNNVAPLFAADKYDLSDWIPRSRALYDLGGKIYGFPRSFGVNVLYLNTSLFQRAGIPLPTTDWKAKTWTRDDFERAARSLTQAGATPPIWGYFSMTGIRLYGGWLASNGGRVLNAEGTAIALTEEPAVEAFQWLQDLVHKLRVAPNDKESADGGGYLKLFGAGRIGMSVNNGSANAGTAQAASGFTYDIRPQPLGKAGIRACGGGGTGWAVAQPTKNPTGAWDFFKYEIDAKNQLQEQLAGITTCGRRSVIYSPEVLKSPGPPAAKQVFADATDYVVNDPLPKFVAWSDIDTIVANNLKRLWSGEATAREVMAAIKREADPILAPR
jgi:multiple sugar transport system substrate-binding protein